MPSRILVCSASVGGGHVRAAQAMELALRERLPDGHVENVDLLELTNGAFRKLYGEAYLDLVNRAPHLLGWLYDVLDAPPEREHRKRDRFRLAFERLNLRRFESLLTEGNWDLVVNTHFLPTELVAALRSKGRVDVPQMTVTTDFATHRLWLHAPCERYSTATEEGARYLQALGVDRDAIRVTGIPIHPVFSRLPSRRACLESQGLEGDRPIVLQLAGGFGVGPVERIHRSLLELNRPIELVTVTGRNEEARAKLSALEVPSRHRRHVLGFTDRIHELMAVADLVISKPGGLTTSEVLACGAAMAILNPIPGQESRNSDFLLEGGAAVKISSLATLGYKVESLLEDEKRLRGLQKAAKILGRPKACFEIADLALELAGS